MGKASNWLKEERRKTLGDWVSVCLGCGFAQRYFEEWEAGPARSVPAVRGRDALAVSVLQCPLHVGVHSGVRGVWRGDPAARALRHADPEAGPLAPDLGEADHRHRRVGVDRPVVELPEEVLHLLGPADLRVVVLDLAR